MRGLTPVIGLLLAASVSTQAAEVRLVTLEYPPYTSQHLAGGGSMIEPLTRVFASSGHSVRIEFRPWARAIHDLRQGKYDGILPLWPDDVAAEKLIDSPPQLYSDLGFFMRRDTPISFNDLGELTGRKVGTVRGYNYPKHIIHSGFLAEEAVDDLTNLRKLAAGRFDLVLLEQQVGEYLLSREPELQKQLVWQGQILARLPLSIGFTQPKAGAPDWPQLYKQGLKQLNSTPN